MRGRTQEIGGETISNLVGCPILVGNNTLVIHGAAFLGCWGSTEKIHYLMIGNGKSKLLDRTESNFSFILQPKLRNPEQLSMFCVLWKISDSLLEILVFLKMKSQEHAPRRGSSTEELKEHCALLFTTSVISQPTEKNATRTRRRDRTEKITPTSLLSFYTPNDQRHTPNTVGCRIHGSMLRMEGIAQN